MAIKGRILTRFTGRILAGAGITVTKANGVWTVAPNLTAGAGITIDTVGNSLVVTRTGPGGREAIAADRTYFVRTDGSDSNTGLTNTAGGAFLTIQKAVDTALQLDAFGHVPTISVADGTYDPFTVAAQIPGISSTVGTVSTTTATFKITGNTTTPANVVITRSTTGSCINVSGQAKVVIAGFKLTTTGGVGSGIDCQNAAQVYLGQMDYGALNNGHHIQAGTGASVFLTNSYTISGTAVFHIHQPDFSSVKANAITVTLSGTPNFSGGFLGMSGATYCYLDGVTFSGSATGPRCLIHYGGVLDVRNQNDTFLPGNSAIAIRGGGIYAGIVPIYSEDQTFSATITPLANDGAALGTSALKWSDIHLAAGAVINFNSSDVTISHSANLLAFAGAATGYTFDSTVAMQTVNVSGPLTASGGTRFGAATSNTAAGAPNNVQIEFNAGAANGTAYKETAGTNGGKFIQFVNSADAEMGSIQRTNSTTTAYNTTSDGRLKIELGAFDPRAILDGLRIVKHGWHDNDDVAYGVIAQEAYEVYPQMITKGDDDPDKRPGDEGFRVWQGDYAKVVPVLIAALQDALRRLDDLEGR